MPAPSDDELIQLETRFWQTMIDKDVEAALALTNDPCIVTGGQGVSRIDADSFARMMAHGTWQLKKFAFSDIKVERIAEDVAIIGYKVREELVVDGELLVMEAADASTWVRRPEGWKCALHTESVSGDPFGRDRTGAAH
jgi:hypothetical protein